MPKQEIQNHCQPITVAATGHDPEGKWVRYLGQATEVIRGLYNPFIFSFTSRTHKDTLKEALGLTWQVEVDDLPMGRSRFRCLEIGLQTNNRFINLWDGDRLIHAATISPDELSDISKRIRNYHFFIAGATPESIATHQPSMTCWEQVKSYYLGKLIGVEGDIATRGCFGFSQEFAQFVVTNLASNGDETDGLFTALAVVFRDKIQAPKDLRAIGYKEYNRALDYEDWLFDGLSQQESARKKDTMLDFHRRTASVLRCLLLVEDILASHKIFPPNQPRINETLFAILERAER